MAATGDGAGDYLRTAATFTPITNEYTWAFWYFPTGAPVNGAPSRHPFAFVNSTGGTPGGYDVNFAWDHVDAAFYKSAVHRNAAGTFATAQYTGTPPSGRWVHIAGVFNGSTIKLYVDGVEAASEAASSPSGVMGNPELTVLAYDNTTGFDDASVGEVCIWDVALTAAEVLSIAQGTAANDVQTGNVVSYSRINTGDITTTGNALTNTGCALNQAFFEGIDGGIEIGGDNMASQIYNLTMDGGLEIGGDNFDANHSSVFTMSGGLSIGGGMDVFQILGNGAHVMIEGRGPAYTEKP